MFASGFGLFAGLASWAVSMSVFARLSVEIEVLGADLFKGVGWAIRPTPYKPASFMKLETVETQTWRRSACRFEPISNSTNNAKAMTLVWL